MSELASEGEVRAAPEEDAARSAQRGLVGRLALLGVLAVGVGLLVDLLREPGDPAAERRSWSSPRADGFGACAALAARLGHRVLRQTASWGQLPDPAGHTLVVVDPRPYGTVLGGQADLDGPQVRALGAWVRAGGHLVLAPAGRHTVDVVEMPLAELAGGEDVTVALIETSVITHPAPLAGPLEARPPLPLALDGLRALSPDDEVLAAAWLTWSGRPLRLVEARRGVAELQVFDERFLPDGLTARVDLGGAPFVLAGDREAGRIWLLASAYPFTGKALEKGGAGPLVAGLLHEATDGGQRTLLLDERCHGLGARRGLLGPLRGAGLGIPAGALLLLAGLVAWRGAVREGSPRPPRGVPRRAKEEFVVALGDLLRRGGRHDAAARALAHVWRERLAPLGQAAEADRLLAAATKSTIDDEALARLGVALREAAERAASGERPRSDEAPGPSAGLRS